MQFTSEVNWKLFDFLFAGVLLFGTGLILIFGKRKCKIYHEMKTQNLRPGNSKNDWPHTPASG